MVFKLYFFILTCALIGSSIDFIQASYEGNLIDGDIMLLPDEDPWDRKLSIFKEKRWPNAVVPYDFNQSVYSLLDLYIIRQGLDEIEKSSCLKFVRRTNEQDYIYLTPLGGCWSYIGRNGMQQTLSLVVPDCIVKGTVIHEFMHALGFWHEHSRIDRDDYIDVLWQNVMNDDKKMNFAKHIPGEMNFLNYPYDYRSIMHYNAYAFSKLPGLPTMKPKKSNVKLKDLGRAKYVGTLTDIDKLKLNEFYDCSKN
ncbi:zinc metalloproteinase nas-4-like [Uloborus diversus]|uniref:zinc metalloproteinase nas-4-like n=1 Tax=Uloborus diversus TaxID=327109 RepID=UPI0024092C3D|nr:zinc metalloproteinase nas-4-like [Uloborus diversus]